MLKMWGRNTSSNVQKAMWAVGELKLPCERIDVGGAFGKTKEPFYLAMNPNSLVPTLEEDDGFTLWESNSIVRYLAGKHGGTLEPKDPKVRAKAQQWMDWQLSVMGPEKGDLFSLTFSVKDKEMTVSDLKGSRGRWRPPSRRSTPPGSSTQGCS